MPKLTYWVAPIRNDSPAYSLRARTKRECAERRANSFDPEQFGEPRKVTIEYTNAFDLVTQLLGEGGTYHEEE